MPKHVLIVHGDGVAAADVRLCVESDDWPHGEAGRPVLLHARSLAEACGILQTNRVEAILASPDLPDSSGPGTFVRLSEAARSAMLIALLDDESLADGPGLLETPAQDFIARSGLSPVMLWRGLHGLAERVHLRRALGRAIADRESARQARDNAKRATRRARRVKTDFLSLMSHEFRTPLNGIIGLSAALEREVASDAHRSMADGIRTAGESVVRILDDIFDVLALEAGDLTLDRAPFDPRALLDDVIESWREPVEAKGLALTVETHGAGPQFLLGDARRIGQALSQLVGNAAKYTETGGITVVLSVPDPGAAQPHVRFDVVDTGSGLPDRARRRLGKAFERGDMSPARAQGGVGLGLTLTMELVSAMNGTVDLTEPEDPRQGTHVWFSIPCDRVDGPGAALARPATVASANGRPSPRVLVVDDSALNRQVFDAILKSEEIQYDFAVDGHEAITKADSSAYDLILMDIQMPGLDGVQTAQHLRQRSALNARTPIAAVTAHGLSSDRARYLAAGMDDYLAKPVRPEALLDLIRRNTGPDAGARS